MSNDELVSKFISTYNNNNDVLEEDIYTLQGLSLSPPMWDFKAISKYDDRGNLIEKDEYRREEGLKPYQVTNYIYDEKNHLVSMNEVEYSGKGVKKRNSVVKNNFDDSEQKFQTYDSNNNKTSEASTSYSNTDKKGNWRLSIDDFM